jgi:tripartite-type tricarboxylate transporter receptor subunit TctC
MKEQTVSKCLRYLTACAALFLVSFSVQAQFPSKPIRMLVPFPAGSATDTVARILAPALAQSLGQPVIVENKPGADGAIAGMETVRAAPDGHTLMLGTNSPLTAVPTLRKEPPYSINDFTPISTIGRYTFLVLINAEVPAKTLSELLAYARANPNKLNYATGNTTGILSTAQMMSLGNIKMVQVPYKGEPAAIADLVAGRVQVMFATPTTALAFVKEGRLRALATTNSRRTSLLPEVPTMSEAGMPGFSMSSWAALVGPAKMPKDVTERISREINAAFRRPDVREQLDRQAFEFGGSTPEELGTFIKEQFEVWTRVAREAGIKPE